MTPIKHIVQVLVLVFYRLLNRIKNSPENIKRSIQQASQVFICLPADEQDRQVALEHYSKWKACFPSAVITGVIPVTLANEPDTAHSNIMVLNKNDINIWGIPGKRLKTLLKGKSFNIAIDLNRNYNAFSALLTILSGAEIRAGYYHPNKTLIYNFLLRVSPETSSQHAIQAFLTYFNVK